MGIEFKADAEYGYVYDVPAAKWFDKGAGRKEYEDLIHVGAELALPVGTPYEIRQGIPYQLGKVVPVGWAYEPKMLSSYDAPIGYNAEGGYYVISRHVVGEPRK